MSCDLMTQDYQRYLAAKERIVDDELFPRRRDVRAMAEEVLHTLLAFSDEDGEFGHGFLTDVRDLMREGVPFADAVGAYAPEILSNEETQAALQDYQRLIELL